MIRYLVLFLFYYLFIISLQAHDGAGLPIGPPGPNVAQHDGDAAGKVRTARSNDSGFSSNNTSSAEDVDLFAGAPPPPVE